jgi:hypothetical protein
MGSPFGAPYQPQYSGGYAAPPSHPSQHESPIDHEMPQHTNEPVRGGDDVAAMRRELDELKQAVRESIGAKTPRPTKKRKPTGV